MNQNNHRADKMIFAARRCLGVPFHHQGRQPEFGLDCIGLVVVALRAVGADVRDQLDYSSRPDGMKLVDALIEHGAVKVGDISPADVLLFRYDNQPQHVALATSGDTMIHSFAPAGRVVETFIGDYWRRRMLGSYRFSQLME
ncbi:MAG: NlpC/P60 family protein [Alphaproteobacteria bacterium]|nr:NlpC/P60 family protein [Alphaproteobacteria bacterium]